MGKIIVGQSTNFLCFSMIDFNYLKLIFSLFPQAT